MKNKIKPAKEFIIKTTNLKRYFKTIGVATVHDEYLMKKDEAFRDSCNRDAQRCKGNRRKGVMARDV